MPPTPAFNIQTFFDKLFTGILEGRLTQLITSEDVLRLLSEVRKVFQAQPMFLKISAPVVICGDLHGQLNDVMRIFQSEGFPHVRNYLFLGDYVDRGTQSVELILFMYACKIKYPRNFFLLRGNHETLSINRIYGFHRELMDKYNSNSLYEAFQLVFDFMPLSAVISERILCMHGGLSNEMLTAKSLDIINDIPRPLTDAQINPAINPLAVNLLWADPDVNVRLFGSNRRGIGHTFGQDVIDRVRNRFGLDMVIRAHQVIMDGHEFFNDRFESGLITVFSAPHYCGMYNNSGAVVRVTADLSVSFKVFTPQFQKPAQNEAANR